MTKYTSLMEPVPQTEQENDKQVKNSAGGYSFGIDSFGRLERFLILGSDSNTYYATKQKLTRENAKCVSDCLKAGFKKAVDMIVDISQRRAPKNDPCIFALALACANKDVDKSKYALGQIDKVCRTATHLFQFIEDVDSMRGWGNALKRHVGNWYTNKSIDKATYQVIKYRNRAGWTHRDVLRKVHPRGSEAHNALFAWIVGKGDGAGNSLIEAFEKAKTADKKTLIKLIQDHGLTHEMIPNGFLTDKDVYGTLLESMPMMAMVRNLGNMSKMGLLTDNSDATRTVVDRLNDSDLVWKSHIHPVSLLMAGSVYSSGHGLMGSGSWKPVRNVVDGLETAFYSAFKNVTPSKERYMLSLDVSGSMDSYSVAGTNLTPMQASAAMALVTAKCEPYFTANAFTSKFSHFPISKTDTLKSVFQKMKKMSFDMGGTDCSQPVLHALRNKIPVDKFVIYTDNETWAGEMHPHKALEKYRKEMKINAKLVVVGMVANGFSIANPDDAGMLDVVGFDTSTPELISNF